MRIDRRHFATLVLGLCISLSTAGLGFAQSAQGGLRGAVKDAQGVIPGVTVTLTSESTGVSRDTVTNDSGEYSFPALDPSSYSVKAGVQGFKTFERRGIRIGAQQFVTLDITLEVGTVAETITVTADAPLIETSNASHAEVLDAKTLEALPSVGRNVFLMATTVPTVQSSGDTHWNRMQDQSGASTLSIGGGGVRANNYLLDGFPITDLQNRSSTNPSTEMVEDIRVQVHTYDSEMGRTGGGVFNTAAKSGSNQFRGSAYYLTRPSALIGGSFFNEIRGLDTNDQFWRSGGGGFGGPIFRNKTFFYLAGEGYKDGQAQQTTLHVPTAAMRNGDFSNFRDAQGRMIPIYDPLTTDASGNRQPFPGNIIPANRINPVGRAFVNALPLPTLHPEYDDNSPNLPAQNTIESTARQMSLKLDHHFNENVSLNGTFLNQSTFEPDANYFPDAPYAASAFHLQRDVNVFVLNNTYIVNPSTVATFRAGMNTFSDDNVLPYEFDMRTVPGINPAFANSLVVQKFPALTLTGYPGTGNSGLSDVNYYSWGFNGAVNKLAGSHSLKTGADYRVIGVDALANGQSAGSYTFSGTYTRANQSAANANAIADLLLGYPSSGTLALASRFDQFVKYYAWFVQDDWRVSDRLTMNLGIRLEHETGLAERDNKMVVGFDRSSASPLNVTIPADPVAGTPARQVLGGLVFAGQNGAKEQTGNAPAVKVSPRFGMAYTLNDKTVVRAGYGLFYGPWQSGAQQTPGYSQTTTLQTDPQRPFTTIDNPFPGGLQAISGNSLGLLTGVSSAVTFIDPDRTAPRVHQYSADIQRQLPGDMSIGVTYMGSLGRNLTWGGTATGSVNINQVDPKYLALGTRLQDNLPNPFFGNPAAGGFASRATLTRNQLLRPFPQFDNVNMIYSTLAKSKYDAGVISVTKRASGWWGGRFSYTYSRLYDNQFAQGNYYSGAPGILNNYTAVPWSEYFDPDAEYGRSLLDSPHKMALSPILRLPFGRGQKYLQDGIGNVLAGGWTVSFVIQLQSGFPLGVSQNTNNTFLLGAGQRPNVVAGVDPQKPGSITERLKANPADDLYLNDAAFTQAPPGTFGNAPRIIEDVYSPWRNSTDMALSKDVSLGGTRRVSVRLDVINVFNNPWFAALGSTAWGNANFGRVIAQANYSRTMQVTGRFSF
ncbi:MAG TPA: TonB-dependent receptor [Vicinamibacterales bacterium]|nr:TonB-dependent receptor [Vicinamibacterales bacterium]